MGGGGHTRFEGAVDRPVFLSLSSCLVSLSVPLWIRSSQLRPPAVD